VTGPLHCAHCGEVIGVYEPLFGESVAPPRPWGYVVFTGASAGLLGCRHAFDKVA